MRNAWRLFVGDLRRLRSNVITIITVIGLVALPSIFSWYNMLACWNVFDNTGNLTVAVANVDEGYVSDLVPIKISVGDQVVSALRENDQLNWTFTSKEEAIDGAQSGRYYAAVVIPESFSRDMMSFFSGDAEHARISYYSNEKKNAVAPKVTDQGADQVSRQVNLVFTETLTEIGLGIAQALSHYADDANVDGAMGNLGAHLRQAGSQLADSGQALALYADVVGSTRQLIDDSNALLSDAATSSENVEQSTEQAHKATSSIVGTLDEAAEALETAIDKGTASYSALPTAIDAAFDSADALAADAASQLRNQAEDTDTIIADLNATVSLIQKLPYAPQNAIDRIVRRLNATIELQKLLRDALNDAASNIESSSNGVKDERASTKAIAEQAKRDIDDARADYEVNLAPALGELSGNLADAGAALALAREQLDGATGELAGSASSLSDRLADMENKLRATADELSRSGNAVSDFADRFTQALETGDDDALREVLDANPTLLAEAISAPVAVDRHAVFPVENFGSAMSPLYTTLALWIGALVMMVTLKLTPSERTIEELNHPSPRQVLLGRFGIVAFISVLQSTTIALGNLFFLGVQAVHPLLYLVCFWVAGLVFAFIIYTLVALFANLGKALSVILLIVQVSGGGGSFPMQLLPGFFQAVSPYLPITHAVNAMRAAMFGIYANDFWIEICTLALFAVPLAIAALFLHKPLSLIVPKFVERVERSKLM